MQKQGNQGWPPRQADLQATYLSVDIKQVESKDVYSDLDVFSLNVFPLASTELLEGQDLVLFIVERDCLCIQDEGGRARLDAL